MSYKTDLQANNTRLDNLKTEINNLPTFVDTTDANATESDILQGKSGYVNGVKVNGSLGIETKTVKSTTTSQTVTPSVGKFINEITVEPMDLEQITINPSTSQQIITPSQNKDGIIQVTASPVTSAIDENIVSGNIKANSTILGVQGKSSVVDTETATAQAKDIMTGKTAYVNGLKVTGTNDNPDWTEIGYTETPQYIIDGFEYAKEIYDNWDSSITTMWQRYKNNQNLKIFPNVDMTNVENMYEGFYGCSNLTVLNLNVSPKLLYIQSAFMYCSFEEINNFNTQLDWAASAFRNNTKLKKLPALDTSKISNGGLNLFVGGCSSLSNESLNNVMQMCINAVRYTSNKTLAHVGLSSSQATRCQSLSNWNAFVEAGWTTGY